MIAVDCIDCAADASVVSAVNEGIEAAMNIVPLRRPWVMISVNDDEDLHFRKAGDLQCVCLFFGVGGDAIISESTNNGASVCAY